MGETRNFTKPSEFQRGSTPYSETSWYDVNKSHVGWMVFTIRHRNAFTKGKRRIAFLSLNFLKREYRNTPSDRLSYYAMRLAVHHREHRIKLRKSSASPIICRRAVLYWMGKVANS